MNKDLFSFDLPRGLIAQHPLERRDGSRLLCLDRRSGETSLRRFFELPSLLREGDCLVLNDSRVIPARLLGKRETGGAVEVLILGGAGGVGCAGGDGGVGGVDGAGVSDGAYETSRGSNDSKFIRECLTKPSKKLRNGARLFFGDGDGELTATVVGDTGDGGKLLEFHCDGELIDALKRIGRTPLPHYIHEDLRDKQRYQTVYSRVDGSAAAPTAGLHFTPGLLYNIAERGVETCFVTLHVGPGTFSPVRTEEIERHRMHSEHLTLPAETAEKINRAKKGGGRIVAVGTTSCRALEICATKSGEVVPFTGSTDIFIYPGYGFKCVDALLTNFHLPESTLLMLVCAFAGRENTLRAYSEAIEQQYRFYSFGDAMFIA
jgi:S-adenosylmethionine:tRNA ribosyltransferase-isomerase